MCKYGWNDDNWHFTTMFEYGRKVWFIVLSISLCSFHISNYLKKIFCSNMVETTITDILRLCSNMVVKCDLSSFLYHFVVFTHQTILKKIFCANMVETTITDILRLCSNMVVKCDLSSFLYHFVVFTLQTILKKFFVRIWLKRR